MSGNHPLELDGVAHASGCAVWMTPANSIRRRLCNCGAVDPPSSVRIGDAVGIPTTTDPPGSVRIVTGTILMCGERRWSFDGKQFLPLNRASLQDK